MVTKGKSGCRKSRQVGGLWPMGSAGSIGLWAWRRQGRPWLDGYGFAISRHVPPEFCISFALIEIEGAGKTGCALHPRSRVQLRTENAHTSIQVRREHPGLPCAMALRLIRALPGRAGLVVTVALEKLASQELDASIGASGPHDFAVRVTRLRPARASRPPHPTARP